MLYLQSGQSEGGYLLEHILYESIGALSGGGLFAWASRQGANLLLRDPIFSEFLSGSPFEVVVGLDSITDDRALGALSDAQSKYPGSRFRAFINPVQPLFHPKLSWFETSDRLCLIVGSGNLTLGGLRSNWEAFSVEYLVDEAAAHARSKISEWLARYSPNLVPVHDEQAVDLARRNRGSEAVIREQPQIVPSTQAVVQGTPVLIAEIPRAGSRWEQANFNLDTYTDYFGAKQGTQRRVLLRWVDEDGGLGSIENRPSVEVASHNYRFELAAAKGRPYPSAGRPIATFAHTARGEFYYYLTLPGEDDYDELMTMLDARLVTSAGRMRRERYSLEEFVQAVPGSQLLIALDREGAGETNEE